MIACCREGRGETREYTACVVLYLRELAVHRGGCAHDLAAECLPDRLMSETDAEQRDFACAPDDQFKADAGFIRRAWARRENDRLRIGTEHGIDTDLIVAMDGDVGSQPAQIMEQVESEAVVIVDQDQHAAHRLPVYRRGWRGVKLMPAQRGKPTWFTGRVRPNLRNGALLPPRGR